MKNSRKWFGALLIGGLLVCAPACDKSDEQPGAAEQKAKDDVGTVWRTLLADLDQAPDDETRVVALKEFIAKHPEHPDISNAKQRLADLQNTDELQAKAQVEDAQRLAFEEGDLKGFVSLGAILAAHRASPRSMTDDDLAEPVTLPTRDGTRDFERPVLLTPPYVRWLAGNVFRQFAPDQIERRCGTQCVNEAFSGALEKPLGGSLFVGEAKMNPEAVKQALELARVEPEDQVAGTAAKGFYAVFAPTVKAYLAVGNAVVKAGGEKAAGKLAEMDKEETKDFYASWFAEKKIAEASKVDPDAAKSITTWWLRRYADGTAELFREHLDSIVTTFETKADEN